jgi:hypothetical protein
LIQTSAERRLRRHRLFRQRHLQPQSIQRAGGLVDNLRSTATPTAAILDDRSTSSIPVVYGMGAKRQILSLVALGGLSLLRWLAIFP